MGFSVHALDVSQRAKLGKLVFVRIFQLQRAVERGFSLFVMASLHCTNSVDAIDDIIEMAELLKTFGISGKGVSTLKVMKTRVKEHLGEDVNSNWIAGEVLFNNVLSALQ